MSSHDSHLPLAVIDKHFRILALPNGPQRYQGGQSVVYRGQDKRNGVYVAIKIPHATEGFTLAESQQRFAREVAFLEKLDHPGIVRLYGCSKKPTQRPFCVMPWIAGVTLRQAMQQPGVLQLPMRLIILQALETLQYLHGQGVLHRDIKPDNLIYDEHHRQLVLIDLGIATKTDTPPSNLTGKVLLGTREYLAPEFAHEKRHTPETDIWAIAKTLLELINTEPEKHHALRKIFETVVNAQPDKRKTIEEIKESIKKLPEPTTSAGHTSPRIQNNPTTTARNHKPQPTTLKTRLEKAKIRPIDPKTPSNIRKTHLEELAKTLNLPLTTQINTIDFELMPFTVDGNHQLCYPYYASRQQLSKKQFRELISHDSKESELKLIYSGQHWMSDNGPAVNISLEQVEAFIKLLSPAIAKTLRSNPTGLEEHWSPGLPTSKQMRRIFELGPRSSEHSPNSFLHYTQEQTSRPDGFHDSLQFINGTVRTIQHRKTTVVPHAGFIITLTYKYEDN